MIRFVLRRHGVPADGGVQRERLGERVELENELEPADPEITLGLEKRPPRRDVVNPALLSTLFRTL